MAEEKRQMFTQTKKQKQRVIPQRIITKSHNTGQNFLTRKDLGERGDKQLGATSNRETFQQL